MTKGEEEGIGKKAWHKVKSLTKGHDDASPRDKENHSSKFSPSAFLHKTHSNLSKSSTDITPKPSDLETADHSTQASVFDTQLEHKKSLGRQSSSEQPSLFRRLSSRLSRSSIDYGRENTNGHLPTISEPQNARQKFLEEYDKATMEIVNKIQGCEYTCVAESIIKEVAPWHRESGYLGYLTEPQEKALEQMKAWFPESNKWHTDHDILRFLRAREFDLQKTKQMYKHYIAEYRGNQMNSPNPVVREMACKEAEDLTGLYPARDPQITEGMIRMKEWFVHTAAVHTDKNGLPVVYFRPADILKQNMNKYIPLQTRIAFQSGANEGMQVYLRLLSKQLGFNIESVTQVLDLKGMSAMEMLSHMRSQGSQKEWEHNMDFHPEMLHKIFLINAPTGMSAVWKFASYFVPLATRKKVEVFGSKDYFIALKDAIGSKHLPTCYGGEFQFEFPAHRPIKELKKLVNA